MSGPIYTRGAFLALFTSTPDAIAFEQQCLAVARDAMPPSAIAVLDGGDFSPPYWAWLANMLIASRERGETHARALIAEGTVWIEGGEYVGRAADGVTVTIGTIGEEHSMYRYLDANPTPASW